MQNGESSVKEWLLMKLEEDVQSAKERFVEISEECLDDDGCADEQEVVDSLVSFGDVIADIPSELSFLDVYECLKAGRDINKILKVHCIAVRRNIFKELSLRLGVSFWDVYEMWVASLSWS